MDLQLAGKVIIVTGGDKGIGFGIATTLVEEGAIPFIISRKEADVQKAVKTLSRDGAEVGYALAELTDPGQCKAAVEKVVAEFGQIDGLVNNAGVNDSVSLASGDDAAFVRSLERNVVHYYRMAHLVLPCLKDRQGAIVNIGSKVSLTGQGGTSGYAAANGGRNALTREWAVELLPHGIRVNAVIVAECFTPLYQRWIDTFDHPEEKLAAISRNIPLGQRMTTARELGDTVAFLLSPRSSHTTGQLLFVDGGYVHLDRAL